MWTDIHKTNLTLRLPDHTLFFFFKKKMAAFTEKTDGKINGNKTESAHFDKKGKPGKLPKDIKALRDKYGYEQLYQILGREADGSSRTENDGLRQRNVDTSRSFPVRLYQPDPYDSTVEMKVSAPNSLGQKMLTDKDLEYLARKRDQVTAAEFKQFVASMYNLNDPAQKALLNAAFPSLLQEQKQVISDRCELQKRLTTMALVGHPESQEDFALLFALNSGAVQLPTGDMWDPASWGNAIAKDKATAFARGFFSPVKVSRAGEGNNSKSPFDMLRWATTGEAGRQESTTDWLKGWAASTLGK